MESYIHTFSAFYVLACDTTLTVVFFFLNFYLDRERKGMGGGREREEDRDRERQRERERERFIIPLTHALTS